MLRHPGVRTEGDPHPRRHGPPQRLAGDRDAPPDLGQDLRRIGVRICGQPLDIAVHRRQGRDIVGPRLAEKAQRLVVENGAVFDGVGTQPQRHIDPVRAMGVDRDLETIQVGRLDQGAGLILEHLGTQTGADAAVDPTGGGDLDHPGTAADLYAHRLAATLRAVADIVVGHGLTQVVVEPQPPVHMARGGRDAVAGIDDARSGQAVCGSGVRQRQGHPALVAEVPHRGEAGHQRLLGVFRRAIGMGRQVLRDAGQEAGLTAEVGHQMHMAVDQAGQDEPVALVDHGRAGKGGGVHEAVADLDDQPVAHHHGRGPARHLARPVQQTAGVDQGDGTGFGRRGLDLGHHRRRPGQDHRHRHARHQSVHLTLPQRRPC